MPFTVLIAVALAAAPTTVSKSLPKLPPSITTPQSATPDLIPMPTMKAPTNVLPVFTFRNIVADQPLPSKLGGYCIKSKEFEEVCGDKSQVAGVDANVTIGIYGGLMAFVSVTTDQKNYATLRAALEAKYGSPCGASTSEWQSRGGVKVDNQKLKWCFVSGKLVLDEFGSKLTETRALYIDSKNSPPERAPQVDF